MRHERQLTISYILGVCYIIIALFLADWAFHMVPHKNINKKAILDIFVCIYPLILGILLLTSSLFISRSKIYGYKLFRITFWFGLIVLLCGSIGGAVFFLNGVLIGALQIGSVMGILYLPMVILYLSQKRNTVNKI